MLALTSDSLSLHEMTKRYGEAVTKLTLVMLLSDFDQFLGLKNRISDSQLEFVADILMRMPTDQTKGFGYMKISEVNLALEREKANTSRKYYERLDHQTLITIFEEYDSERNSACVERASMEKRDIERKLNDAEEIMSVARWYERKIKEATEPKKQFKNRKELDEERERQFNEYKKSINK